MVDRDPYYGSPKPEVQWAKAWDDNDLVEAQRIVVEAEQLAQMPTDYSERTPFSAPTLEEYNDEAILGMFMWSATPAESYEQYAFMHDTLEAMRKDTQLPLDTRKIADEFRFQISVLYPEYNEELFRQRRIKGGFSPELKRN